MKNQKLREMLSKANKNQMEKSNDTAFEVLNKSEEELIKGGGGIQADSKGCTCKRGEFNCTTFG
jgi:hypothetical protein